MSIKIFVNLPVADLPKSMAFFKAIGFKNNKQFTDDTAACMVLAEDIYVMLLTHKKFKEFTPRKIADANKVTEVLNALSFGSKAKVNSLAEKALAAGGSEPRPQQDHGFMFSRSIADPDGHIWELFWMNPKHVAG